MRFPELRPILSSAHPCLDEKFRVASVRRYGDPWKLVGERLCRKALLTVILLLLAGCGRDSPTLDNRNHPEGDAADRGALQQASVLSDEAASIATPLLSGITAIDAGDNHTCALTKSGQVVCWGNNEDGQLGDGSDDMRSTPIFVEGLNDEIVAISSGGGQTCAITSPGALMCWGDNTYPDLVNSQSDSETGVPTFVQGLESGVVGVSVGDGFACALIEVGAAQCWGSNFDGQLGDGTFQERVSPAAVIAPDLQFVEISAGARHACALTSEGAIYCWGDGEGSRVDEVSSSGGYLPKLVPVPGVSFVHLVAGDGFTCAETSQQRVYCWASWKVSLGKLPGSDPEGSESRIASSDVQNPVTAGESHACLITEDGYAQCWGENEKGQLGIEATESCCGYPQPLYSLGNVKAITAGAEHTCALLADTTVYCWGGREHGQLGDGSTEDSVVPTQASSIAGRVAAVSAGGEQTCILTNDSTVECWGYGHDTFSRADPAGFQTISAGEEQACALDGLGAAYCWGDGASEPTLGSTGQAILAGWGRTCAIDLAGAVTCWGPGQEWEQRNGLSPEGWNDVLKSVALSSGVQSLGLGSGFGCAVTSTGGVVCWGEGGDGELGDGAAETRSAPVSVVGLSEGVLSVSSGHSHTCALKVDGKVSCWGSNSAWLSSDENEYAISTPIEVSLPSPAVSVNAGDYHTCALAEDEMVYCWGANRSGQLGDGSTESRSSPSKVVDLDEEIVAISAGGSHTCALSARNALFCWGENSERQLGFDPSIGPAQVLAPIAR